MEYIYLLQRDDMVLLRAFIFYVFYEETIGTNNIEAPRCSDRDAVIGRNPLARGRGTVGGHHHVGAIALENGCMGQCLEVTTYKDGLTLPRIARARNCGGLSVEASATHYSCLLVIQCLNILRS